MRLLVPNTACCGHTVMAGCVLALWTGRAPAGSGAGPCQMVLLLQSFCCSVPVGCSERLTGVHAAVALLLHTVLLVLVSTMLMGVIASNHVV